MAQQNFPQQKSSPQPESAAAPKLDLAALADVLRRAPEDVKSELRQALGASGAITRAKQLQNNSDAKRIAFTVGEALHPEGFTPEPSEALVNALGYDEAKRRVSDRYQRNQGITGAVSTITGRDAQMMGIMGEGQSAEDLADLVLPE